MFFFFGHSLDTSDKIYIDKIFEYITKSTADVAKVIVVYHSLPSKSDLIVNLINIRTEENIRYLKENNKLFFVSKGKETAISLTYKEGRKNETTGCACQ